MLRCCPRWSDDEGSHESTAFEAQSHGFGTHCLRFTAPNYSGTGKTRLRLLAKLCRTGLITRRVPSKGFRYIPFIAFSFTRLFLAQQTPATAGWAPEVPPYGHPCGPVHSES